MTTHHSTLGATRFAKRAIQRSGMYNFNEDPVVACVSDGSIRSHQSNGETKYYAAPHTVTILNRLGVVTHLMPDNVYEELKNPGRNISQWRELDPKELLAVYENPEKITEILSTAKQMPRRGEPSDLRDTLKQGGDRDDTWLII